MIDYELTKEQKELRARTAACCLTEIAPKAAELDSSSRDEAAKTVKDNLKKLGKAGYLDLLVKGDFVSQCVAGEELAKSCPSTFLSAMSSGTAFGMAVQAFGSQAQKDGLLPGICAGEKIGAFACTEDIAGSDLSRIETRAELKGGKWVLTGAKDFVTNAPFADTFLVLAWTGPDSGLDKGLSFFLVDRGAAGLEPSPGPWKRWACGAPR